MLYEFELGHNRSNKKHLLYKRCSWLQYSNQIVEEILLSLQEPQWSGRPKIVDFEALLQTIEANLGVVLWEYQVNMEFQGLVWFVTSQTEKKHLELPNFATCNQNIARFLIPSTIKLLTVKILLLNWNKNIFFEKQGVIHIGYFKRLFLLFQPEIYLSRSCQKDFVF